VSERVPQGTELVLAEIEAAQNVVSSLFFDRDFRRAAKPLVQPDMFPNRFDGLLAAMLCDLGDEVDEARVLIEVERRGIAKHADTENGIVSQSGILERLMTGRYCADPLRELDRLREARALRNLRYGLMELERRIGAYEASLGDASTAVSVLLTRASASAGVRVRRLGEAITETMEATTAAARGEVAKRSVQTGFPELDENTGGIAVESTWVMGASTNWGKSTSLVALYLAGRAQGFRPLIVSGEDAESLYARRVLGRIARINPARLRDGKLPRESWPYLTEAVAGLSGDPTPFFLDARGKPSEQVLRETRGAVAAEGIDLLLVDYLQVWRPSERNDRRHEVADIASGFTDIIKSAAHGCAGVLFSQLTVEKGEEPSKESIRESKDVGHRAEVIVLGWTDKQNQRWFVLDKNKDGPAPVRIPVWWDPVSASIVATEPDRNEPQAAFGYGQ
jgi:replicative DNA helicase